MEHSTSLGAYVAYGVIVLFLLALLYFFLRTVAMASLLLLRPAREVWEWIRTRGSQSS